MYMGQVNQQLMEFLGRHQFLLLARHSLFLDMVIVAEVLQCVQREWAIFCARAPEDGERDERGEHCLAGSDRPLPAERRAEAF